MNNIFDLETANQIKTNTSICLQRPARSKSAATLFLLLAFVWSSSSSGFATDAAPTNSAPVKSEESNAPSQELRTYLQLQEQLHSTQLAIERIRKEAADLAAQNNETLSSRLQAIEQSLSAQRARELEAMQSSNRVMLTVAGAFAGMGFVAMLLMGYFQWKTIKGLADISTAMPSAALQLAAPRALAALGPGGDHGTSPIVEQASPALLESIHRLEKRLHELEHPAAPSVPAGEPQPEPKNGNGSTPNGANDSSTTTDAAQITVLLNKGQSLLNADKADEALACFDTVLQIEPNHADALVKKGTALEKMRKLTEAIECYDRAIAADGTLTIAFLYKGGVFNRMERFSEALECYELALRTQEKRRA